MTTADFFNVSKVANSNIFCGRRPLTNRAPPIDVLMAFVRSDSESGGYYNLPINAKLRLIGLNTNLYYKNNKLTVNMPDPGNQMQWLDDVLTDLAGNDTNNCFPSVERCDNVQNVVTFKSRFLSETR